MICVERFQSIKKKIVKFVLIFLLIDFAAITISTVVSMFIIRNNTERTSRELGDTAAESSSASLEQQVEQTLLLTSRGIADQSDEKLRVIENQTEMIANQAAYIYSHPEQYTQIKTNVDYLREDQVGKFALHIKTAEGVTKESIQDELNLISNISPLLCQVENQELNINANYIGSPSGFQLSADKDPQGPNNTNFPVTERSWYTGAVEKGGLYWTDVFVDASANRTSINCSMPYYDEQGTLKGVAVSAATLDEIKKIVTSTQVGETGHPFIVDSKGNVIITDREMKVENGEVVYENLRQQSDANLQQAVQGMLAGEEGIQKGVLEGEDVYLAYSPLTVMPWSIVTVITASEVQAPGEAITKQISDMTEDAVSAMDKQIMVTLLVICILIAVVSGIIIILSRRFSRKVTDPIKSLTQHVKLISNGNLDAPMEPIHTGDEIEVLGEAFAKMTIDLKTYIENVQTITAEKERIGAELSVATQIQVGMLPRIFPPFPDRKEFDLYALMIPAKEVGGDFYDFFMVDDDHLCIVIGDVSGKGVPAALFMVISKTLIKDFAMAKLSPEEIFNKANTELCQDNEAELFTTAWLGLYEISSGKLLFVDAGHDNPIRRKNDGTLEYIKPSKKRLMLAGMEETKYILNETRLEPGEVLLLYTDGVPEASNAADEFYGLHRLEEAMGENPKAEPKETIEHIKQSVDAFVGDAPQFDDLTLLALEIKQDGCKAEGI